MIVRIWHGRTLMEDAQTYRELVIRTGIADYRSVPGNLGAQIWQQPEGAITHIWTVSWWKDIESIRVFAGDELTKAKYYHEDKKYLLEFESHVRHCEVYDFGLFS
jgi:hypothetical protein